MTHQNELIPDIDWLAVSAAPDDSWVGPGPKLINLRPWMDRLSTKGHYSLVSATYGAAKSALQHWETWLMKSSDVALESILDGRPPTEQLAAVRLWLDSPTEASKESAFITVDHTKQLHWFAEEYSTVWFDEPGMWAIESSEYCVLTLTKDPYSSASVESLATIAISCAINAFRESIESPIRDALAVVMAGINLELKQAE